jgi:predicted metal-dependent hydrolase
MHQEMKFLYLNQTYDLIILRKRMRRMIFRVDGDTILVSAPVKLSVKSIINSLEEVFPKLLPKMNLVSPISEKTIYLLGKKYILDEGEIKSQFGISSLQTTSSLFQRQFRKCCLSYFESRVRVFEGIMSIVQPYSVGVRKMETRMGTNSKRSHKVTFALKLIHYPPEVIDAVIVHELSHYFQFNHSPAFYKVVRQFIPDYDYQHRRIAEMRF